MMRARLKTRNGQRGVSLVEVLISLALMGVLVLPLLMVSGKTKVSGMSVNWRADANAEIRLLVQNLRDDIIDAGYLHAGSFNRLLLLAVMGDNGQGMYKAYRIQTVNGKDYLQVSSNNGSWESPFSLPSDTSYRMVSGEFLYCDVYGNCTRFTDTNGDGDWDSGIDAATLVIGSGSPLSQPQLASSIMLYNFKFDKERGSPSVTRTLPQKITIRRPVLHEFLSDYTGHYRFYVLMSSWSADTTVKGIAYDSRRRRVYVVGDHSTGNDAIWRVTRLSNGGVRMRDVTNGSANNGDLTLNPAITTGQDEIAIEENGQYALVLETAQNKIRRVNLASTTNNYTTLDLAAAPLNTYLGSGLTYGLAYDPSEPDYVWVVGKNPSNVLKLYKINKTTNAAPVTTYSLPASLTSPTSLTMDPTTGDFFILQNTIRVSGGKNLLDVYRISRSSPTTEDTFSICLSCISSTTGAGSNFSMAYDPRTNHIFLADTTDTSIMEIVPYQRLYE